MATQKTLSVRCAELCGRYRQMLPRRVRSISSLGTMPRASETVVVVVQQRRQAQGRGRLSLAEDRLASRNTLEERLSLSDGILDGGGGRRTVENVQLRRHVLVG